MKHLWEYDHPYYASENNYYSNEPGVIFESWAEFYEEYGEADMDYNLLIRWDWTQDPDHYLGHPNILQMTYVGQRKGIYAAHFVKVNEADEPAVREFIAKYWAHMQKVWEGS